tara:strand:- start:59 stop:706 length:648 start_codon:yes stop_codon:yes gene_type:complete
MEKVLYIFFTHQDNINNIYDRIKNMMNSLNNTNYIIVQGGNVSNNYDIDTKTLSINCNDKYEGLPEKVLKTYKYIVESVMFNQYTHFIKLDDDMIIKKLIDFKIIEGLNYCGKVNFSYNGNRRWHIGRCSKNSYWNTNEYKGKYTPWCLGGYGYCISRYAINLINDINDKSYNNFASFEDLYIATLLKKINIEPINIEPINISNWRNFFVSPDHK